MGSPTLVAPTSDEEMLALRRRCANALWALVPKGVGRLYFGGGGAWQLWSRSSLSSPPPRTGPRNGHEEQAQRLQVREGRYHDDSDVDRRSAPVSNKNSDMTSAEQARRNPGGQQEARILSEIETGILDVFSDAYCNKHLMYSVLELVIVRLMPELAEKGVIDLWWERLS